nr:ribonuclease H-like domain-containing protein [Tanacetum cinerariifolium]
MASDTKWKWSCLCDNRYKWHDQGVTSSNCRIEGLHKGYDRFQTLLSQLEIHGAGVSHEDANHKFLRSLPSSWSQVALLMRSKPGLDTLSFDDLYNNLRVFKYDVKGTTASSSSNTQNMAFISADNTRTINDLDYDDLEQINDDDLEEMDLKWQNQDSRRRDGEYNGNKARDNSRIPASQDDSKALVTIDGEAVDWSRHVEEDTQNFAMMAYSSSNSGSDNETDAPIIEEYESDSDDDLVFNVQEDKEKPSFAFTDSVKHVKSPRENDKEIGIPNHYPKIEKQDRHSHTKKVFTKTGKIPVNAAKQIFSRQATSTSTASKDDPHKELKDKGIVDSGCSRHMTGNKAHLVDYQEFKGASITFGGSNGRITGKGKIKAGRLDFEDVYYVEELKHYNRFSVSQMCDKKNKVLFTDTDCLVLSPDFKLPDENQVFLKILRQHNMYSFNLKNIDPSGDLSCLFANASIDESNKWHRRLCHVNFKNINKLIKGNLVRGLPSKIFENDHTCFACQKGKKHKASYKAKTRQLTLLLTSRQPIISYLRPFRCHVTILNTIDQLGKFDGKSDSGFLVGYSLNSKAFRVKKNKKMTKPNKNEKRGKAQQCRRPITVVKAKKSKYKV